MSRKTILKILKGLAVGILLVGMGYVLGLYWPGGQEKAAPAAEPIEPTDEGCQIPSQALPGYRFNPVDCKWEVNHNCFPDKLTEAPSVAEYGLDPQPYVPHPSSYQETGVGNTVTWNLELLPNTVLIVGGFRVDGQDGGVYKAVAGPAKITTAVTDGFYAIVASEWGEREFCFRLKEAIRYGWAHEHVHPLPGWTCP